MPRRLPHPARLVPLLVGLAVLAALPARAQNACTNRCGLYVWDGTFASGGGTGTTSARIGVGCYCDNLCWGFGRAETGDCCLNPGSSTSSASASSAWESSCATPLVGGLGTTAGSRPSSFTNTLAVQGYLATWNTNRYGAVPAPVVTVDGVAATVVSFSDTLVTFLQPGSATAKNAAVVVTRPAGAHTAQAKLAWSFTTTFAYDVQRCAGGEPQGAACATADACVPGLCLSGACVSQPALADGTACIGIDRCALAQCQAGRCTRTGSAIGRSCDDGNLCTGTDRCGLDGLCRGTPTNETVVCDDGNECTSSGRCKAGVCAGAAPVNEGRVCAAPASACKVNMVCAGGRCTGGLNRTGYCDDGNPCTRTDSCNASGVCIGANAYLCNDTNSCTDEVCDGKGGCF